MVNHEQQLSRLGPASFFGSLNIFGDFDYLITSKACRKYITLVTADSAYAMRGLLGWCNTPAIYQQRISEEVLQPTGIYGELNSGCLQRIDASLLYASSLDE